MSDNLSKSRFRLYFQLQLISQIGSWTQSIALNGATLKSSSSLTSLAWLQIAEALPILLLSSFAAHLVDRVGPVRVLSYTTKFAGILAVLTACLGAHPALPHIYLVSILFGVISSFDLPARQAFVYGLCPREEIPKAFAITSLQFHSARIIGPLLGTFVAAKQGIHYCFILNAISYLPLIYCLHWGYFNHSQRVTKIQSVFHEGWKDAFSLVLRGRSKELHCRNFLVIILSAYFINFFCLSIIPLLPAMSIGRELASFRGPSAAHSWKSLGIIQSIISTGSLLGSTLLWVQTKRKVTHTKQVRTWLSGEFPLRLLLLSVVFSSLGIFMQLSKTPFSPNFLVTLAALGSLTVLCLGQNGAMLQLEAPQEFRARFSYLYSLGYFLFAPLGTLFYAKMGNFVSFAPLLCLSAVFALGYAITLIVRQSLTYKTEFHPRAKQVNFNY